jgi:trans-aconitate 2-methyltransferase
MSSRSVPNNPSWEPGRYLNFAGERQRPALDLLARIPDIEAAVIADIGCGPGTLLPLLRARWPAARVLGIDSSPAMLKAAREAFPKAEWPDVAWVEADAATWRSETPPNLIFSNATFHWLADHAALLPRLMEQLPSGGVLAVQMPDTRHGEWRSILRELAAEDRWARWLSGFATPAHTESMAAYHRILAPLAAQLDIWSSEYLHILDGPAAIVDWTRGAGARPYLDRLPEIEKESFLAAYEERIAAAYPTAFEGRCPFVFRRIFLVAARS